MPPKRHSTSSQAGPSQRRRVVESDDSEEEPAATQQSQGGKATMGVTKVRQSAVKLVRLALFHEYQHKALRRDTIVKNVMAGAGKGTAGAFNLVLSQAQAMLRVKFGMELVELRGKAKGAATNDETQTQTQTQARTQTRRTRTNGRLEAIEEDDEDDDDGEDQGGAATQAAKKSGSKTYILRSILSPEIRKLMTSTQPLQMFDEEGERRDEDDYVDSGALIPWDKADGTGSGSVQMMGIRTVILCLVMCSGRTISDDHLHALLKRLNLMRDTILPYSSPDGKELPMTLDKYLDLLNRQQYLEKVKIPGQHHSGEADKYEWRWGNREAEFSEQTAAKWIVEILTRGEETDDDEEDDEDQDVEARRARQKKRKEARARRLDTLNKDIVQAAGGPLTGD